MILHQQKIKHCSSGDAILVNHQSLCSLSAFRFLKIKACILKSVPTAVPTKVPKVLSLSSEVHPKNFPSHNRTNLCGTKENKFISVAGTHQFC